MTISIDTWSKNHYTYGNGIHEVAKIKNDRDYDGFFEKYYSVQNKISSTIGNSRQRWRA